MSLPAVPRRSHSASSDCVNVPDLAHTTLRSRAESSASTSGSTYTILTPQSPSIMAVLDFGKRRSGSVPLLEHEKGDMFEDSHSHPKSLNTRNAVPYPVEQEAMLIGSRSSLSQKPFEDTAGQANLGGSLLVAEGQADEVSTGVTSRTQAVYQESSHESATWPERGSRAKRAVPSGLTDAGSSDQYDDAGAKSGRRLRPRLRSILSAPLASSRHSSSSTLAKVAGALSSRKTSMESIVTPGSHSSTMRPGTPSTPQSSRRFLHSQSIVGRDDAIWIQNKRSSSVAHSPKSPVPANRSIPPTLQRGITSPIPASPQVSDLVAVKVPLPRLDHFDRILPKELKVMIFRKLLENGASRERDRRWSGEVGARRELIRLSRVSKSWRDLCFDGQLWADVDLAPFAAHLSAGTLRLIFHHTAPYINKLSLRNAGSLFSMDLLSTLAAPTSQPVMPTLTTLDLRCCKLDHRAITAIIQNAPRLRSINLKGAQAVNRDVLQCLATSTKALEWLDLSGCCHIDLEDVQAFIEELDDERAGKLRTLRLADIRSRSEESLPANVLVSICNRLSSLETLSLQGCRQLSSSVLIAAYEALRFRSRTSTIRHLNVTGCKRLRSDILPAMTDLFPELRYLEMGGMPAFFQENSQSDRTSFNRFLQSLPHLERLDIEETAGTCIDDSTLKVLVTKSHLTHLQIGFASKITSEAMVNLIRGCQSLKVLEADNTQATGAVMREFQRHHPDDGKLSLVDCRMISAADYLRVAGVSRPREGFSGYAVVPMGYSRLETHEMVTIKAFWSWRRVVIPRGWRETLAEKERELAQPDGQIGSASGRQGGGRVGRGRGWRRKDDSYDAKGLCLVQ